MARCPVHDDRDPSLSIAERDGKVLVHCFAGCPQEDVIAALRARGSWSNNLGPRIPPDSACNPATQGLSLADYARAKRLGELFLQKLELTDSAARAANVLFVFPTLMRLALNAPPRLRLALGGPDRFRWTKGSKPFLYGLWRLGAPSHVVLVEGESDCHTLWMHDIPALGIPGASSWREDRDASHLTDVERIYVVIEPDTGGETLLELLENSSIKDRVALVTLPAKDVSAHYLNGPAGFLTSFQTALDSAESWSAYTARHAKAAQTEAWKQCADLAENTDILEQFAVAVRQAGVVGEDRLVKLLFLALMTRFLERPMSVCVKGPSSTGKSHTTLQVLRFFPKSCFYALSAMSERALVYSEEPLKHRFLVVYEAAGMKGEFASYLIRSLLSEGHVAYETVEKTKDGLKPRRIEREGPTGLIVTTTAIRLHPENETRLFSIPVKDTQDQTRDILRALAKDDREPVDVEPWHALQTWLENAEHRVVIPYAETLAEMVPPVAVRLRRDFGAVLALVKAHAILNQRTHERDKSGAIIADLADYEAVHKLVADLISEQAETTVPKTVRETVAAVVATANATLDATAETEVSVVQVAKFLKLEKSTAWRRVKQAVELGYIRNLEDKKGRPARLIKGDSPPEERVLLPEAVELYQTVAGLQQQPGE